MGKRVGDNVRGRRRLGTHAKGRSPRWTGVVRVATREGDDPYTATRSAATAPPPSATSPKPESTLVGDWAGAANRGSSRTN